MPNDPPRIRRPEGRFAAAEVVGLDPRAHPRDASVAQALRAALAEHGLAVIRLEAKLDEAMFRAVAGLFGAVKDPVAADRDGNPHRYDDTRQIIDAGYVMTDEMREEMKGRSFGGLDADRPGLFETFHIDDTYVAEPASATVLHARVLPPSGGGNTVFIDLQSAWEQLPAQEQARLRPLQVEHAYNNEGAFEGRASASGPNDVLAPATHPLVRTHASTGRLGLFFDLDRATRVEGMDLGEGRALLMRLQRAVEENAPRYEHVWRDFDVLVWDNTRVQHKASGDYPVGEPRRFWRHMIAGTRPV